MDAGLQQNSDDSQVLVDYSTNHFYSSKVMTGSLLVMIRWGGDIKNN